MIGDGHLTAGLDTPAPSSGEVWRPAGLDLASGWVTGHGFAGAHPQPLPAPPASSPLAALETTLAVALASPPCVVAFSGGRDSSLVLAAAVRSARIHGLEPPIAVTHRFPAAPATDETRWQEDVMRHIGGTEWVHVTYADEFDVVGPISARGLHRYGVLWPALAHAWAPVAELARGGSIVTGEGGDEFLGARRNSIAAHIWRQKRVRRRYLPALLRAIAPRPLRSRWRRREISGELPLPWLRPEAKVLFLERLLADEMSEPLRWDRSLDWLSGRRTWRMGSHNRGLIARDAKTRFLDPLQEPAFVAALKGAGGLIGWPSRTALLRANFQQLLPDAVLRRADKVAFNSVVFARHTRELMSEWNGEGIDSEFVDPELLATAWSGHEPPLGTILLLQSALLALGTRGPVHRHSA